MKKIIGLILVFVLVFAVAANAFAGGKPKITKQPETATTNKKGTVSFSIKTSGTVKAIVWHFIDPATGNDYTGKKLSSAVKGVKVSSPNGKTITLKKVPESMHGWTVYAHINGNGYKVDSDKVMLLVYGMDPPETVAAAEPEAEAPAEGDEEAAADVPAAEQTEEAGGETAAEAQPEETVAAKDQGETAETAKTAETAAAEGQSETAETAAVENDEEENAGNVAQAVVITANADVLYRLDDPDNASNSLEFNGSGSFLVKSEEPITGWSVNGIRFEPAEPVNQFKVTNVTSSITLDVKVRRATAADAVVDESHMCKVTCSGCTFSYIRSGLRSVTEGEVPAGARINVVADSSDFSKGGYSVNGSEAVNAGKASFQLEITDDTTIVCQK